MYSEKIQLCIEVNPTSKDKIVESSCLIMSNKNTSVDPPRTRSKSTNQVMRANQSIIISPQSPQLTQPLPKAVLETMMMVQKLPSITQMLYGEESDGLEKAPWEEMEMEEVPIRPVVSMKDFVQVDEGEKLNLLMVAINKINTTFQHKMKTLTLTLTDEEDGVFPRLREVEADIDNFKERIDDLETENTALKDDVAILKGIVQVQQHQIAELQHQAIDAKARSMKNNILVDGITNDVDDELTAKQQALSFLRTQLEMQVEDNEIVKAHRLGEKRDLKPRTMVIKCTDALRGRVFGYTKNLKTKTNENKEKFYVDPQLPDKQVAERKNVSQQIQTVKNNLPKEETATFKIKKNKLYVNNELQKQHIVPLTATALLDMSMDEHELLSKEVLLESKRVVEKGSTFKAYAKSVKSLEDIRRAYLRMRQLHPEADHIVAAYRVKKYEGACDDGEHSAGVKLWRLLVAKQKKDQVVFVIRKYGGIHLGPRRFLIYQNMASEVLKDRRNSDCP